MCRVLYRNDGTDETYIVNKNFFSDIYAISFNTGLILSHTIYTIRLYTDILFLYKQKKHFHNYQIDHIYKSFLEFLQPKQQLMRLDDEYFVHPFLFLIIYSLHAFVYQMVFLRVILRDLTNFILRILIQKTPQDITIFLYFVQFRIWVKLLL